MMLVKSTLDPEQDPLQQPLRADRAVFLSQDCLINSSPLYADHAANLSLLPRAMEALSRLAQLDVQLIVIGNSFRGGSWNLYRTIQEETRAQLRRLFLAAGAVLTDFCFCLHASNADRHLLCLCRKPMPGLLNRALSDRDLCRRSSWMIGDTLDDIESGRRAGCRTILLTSERETGWRPGPYRLPIYIVSCLLDASLVITDRIGMTDAKSEAQAPMSPSHQEPAS